VSTEPLAFPSWNADRAARGVAAGGVEPGETSPYSELAEARRIVLLGGEFALQADRVDLASLAQPPALMELRPSPARAVDVTPYRPGDRLPVPLVLARVEAGFPSPADDHVDRALDLNELVVEHPAATFFVRVAGESMTDAGIGPGDVLVVDRSLEARSGDVVIAVLDGEFLVKTLRVAGENGARVAYLESAHRDFPPIRVQEGHELCVWGVVTSVIRRLRR
jgi:DNA polymerase V